MYAYFKTAYLCIFCFAYMYILFTYGYFRICMPFLLLHILAYIYFAMVQLAYCAYLFHNNNLFTQPQRGDQAGSAHTAKGAGPTIWRLEPNITWAPLDSV